MHSGIRRIALVAGLLAALLPARAGEAQQEAAPPTDDAQLFMRAARTAWAYVEKQYQPATGLVNSVADYPYATVWDMASGLAALYCAHQLDLLDGEEYDRRMRRALRTLGAMKLYQGAAYNKNYSTRTGAVAGRTDRDRRVSERGYGWSVIDLGRLLVWLKIIEVNQPQYAPEVQAIVRKLDYSRLVKDGYLWGEDVSPRGRKRVYQEGRIPYEQYAAAGFAAWGHAPANALSFSRHALPITVLDVPLVADRRGGDHLTSEPLVLLGLEMGWNPEARELALRLLEVQRERHRRMGQVTAVSEDAIPVAPYYFYYYTVNYHGEQFAVVTQFGGVRPPQLRWVSTKAAYGWHALLPGDYTRQVVRAVQPAASLARGWASGVYERTGNSTGGQNVNTAAVVLEAALYHLRGRPLVIPK
jgi:hypothetical protein